MLTGKLRFTPNALTSLPRKTKQEAYKIRPRGTCFKTEREMKKDTPKYVLGLGVFCACSGVETAKKHPKNTPSPKTYFGVSFFISLSVLKHVPLGRIFYASCLVLR